MSKFEAFAALHVPGTPLILFNVWDAGSAKVAAQAAPARSPPAVHRSPPRTA
ncbi:hypothetical protein RZN05_13355 [Sphingomonas sp. HF-S4]|uniref:Uncharacterized protein n=1 Tax=Sphingomonas agrestis TaxID=3080540 RepID=A0ABU3Y9B5_9SPHN|nr:hypothetical protein [Sphingomonas sp. HF-S4]MDV3457976.1 hypothetical protein [Sphingomonas sp. HF-S4]